MPNSIYPQNWPVFIGWRFHCSYFQSNGFRSIFTDRFFQKLTKSEGTDFSVSTVFLTRLMLRRSESIKSIRNQIQQTLRNPLPPSLSRLNGGLSQSSQFTTRSNKPCETHYPRPSAVSTDHDTPPATCRTVHFSHLPRSPSGEKQAEGLPWLPQVEHRAQRDELNKQYLEIDNTDDEQPALPALSPAQQKEVNTSSRSHGSSSLLVRVCFVYVNRSL
jgi:hypothetical protein